jgi:hypothetical protein
MAMPIMASMSEKPKYTPAEKVVLLRKHSIEKEPVSKISEENRLHKLARRLANLFYLIIYA